MSTPSTTTPSGQEVIITYPVSLPVVLSNKTIDAISKSLMAGNPRHYYFDYNDSISEDTINNAIEVNPEHPLDQIYEALDLNGDITYDLEVDALEQAVKDNEELIIADIGDSYEDDTLDYRSMARELRDHFLDEIETDIDIKPLLRKQILVRVTMRSNYDCINSWFFESQCGFEYPQSYFGDMINMLQLNPKKVKDWLVESGYKCYGSWPDKPKWNPLVSMQDFITEMENMSCPVNLLTFVGTVDAYDLLSCSLKDAVVTMPVGSQCGMFSSMQGGGSILEMKMLRPFRIDLDKKYDKSGYLNFTLSIDSGGGDYSIKRVYGVSDDAFPGINISKNSKSKTHV